MSAWPWERQSDVNPWWPETRYMVGWPFAHTCAAMCPYCFVHDAITQRAADGKRWWTDEQAIDAWRNLAEENGPGHIIFSGLEPSEQLPLVSGVLEHHYGAMLTNLTFDADEFQRLIPPERCRIHPSFQPHLWGMKAEPFIEKLLVLQEQGYFILMATIVAYPPYLDRIEAWSRAIEDAGLRAVVIPFQSANFHGKRYPDAYTPQERQVLSSWVSPQLRKTGKVPKRKIATCGAGFASAYVRMNGAVWRCGQVGGMGDQNLMRDGTIKWLDEPKPCPRESCPCTQFHMYHIEEDNDGQ